MTNLKGATSLAGQSSITANVLFAIGACLVLVFRFLAVLTTSSRVVVGLSMHVNGKQHDLATHTMSEGYLLAIIHDMYASSSYITMVLMIFGCIIVPFIRIVMVVLCYVLPLREEHHETRTRILFALDHVGRFIMADLFLAGYAAVFFHITQTFYENHSGVDDISMIIGTEFLYSFYGSVASNILGSALTLHLMSRSFHKTPLSIKAEEDPNQAIFERLQGGEEGAKRRIRTLRFYETKLFTILMLLLANGALIHLVMFRAKIVSFRLAGVVGTLTGSEPVVFDLWTIFTELPYSIYPVSYTVDSAVHLLSSAYLIVIICMPCLLAMVFMIFVLVPLNKQLQYTCLYAFPFWFAWCALDLFLALTCAQYFEMDGLATYLFHDQYPTVCNGLEEITRTDCTRVEAEFHSGIISLAVTTFSLIFVRIRFMWLFQEMSEQETEERLPLIV